MDPTLLNAILGSGPMGIIVWILLQQRKEERSERLAYDKERLETDKRLAIALTSLAIKITGRPVDGD